MNSTNRLLLLVPLLIAFTSYSIWVAISQGYFGFLTLALAQPWGMQLLLDLTIALSFFMIWMIPDARTRGIPALPYVLALLTLGSVGALAYLAHRELRKLRPPEPRTSGAGSAA